MVFGENLVFGEKNDFGENMFFLGKGSKKNKIEIRPIDALFKVLEFTTFSIYLFFQFEYHSNLIEIPIE